MARRTRRVRHEPPKVWHNPDVVVSKRGGGAVSRRGPTPVPEPSVAEPVSVDERRRNADSPPRSGRIVAPISGAADERELERERLLGKLGSAEGRTAITRAADELFKAGFELPADDQHVHLQLLEHSDESRVREAMTQIALILETQPAKRFAVLDSRLRRLEELADDVETREAAALLRKRAKAPATAASA